MEDNTNAEIKNLKYRQGNTVIQVSELDKIKNTTNHKSHVHTVLDYLDSTRNYNNNNNLRKISREDSYDESFNNETYTLGFLNNEEVNISKLIYMSLPFIKILSIKFKSLSKYNKFN